MRGSRVLSVGARRCVLSLVVALGSLTGASVALAGEPTGDFAIFKGCPRFTSGVGMCLYGVTHSGEVTVGGRTFPLERPLVLQGGIEKNEQTSAETLVGALTGETLSREPEKVPGGLFGMPLTATLELAPAGEIEVSQPNIEEERGAGLVLPARIRLENPLLGSECYIGSRSSPIVLRLTTGTTGPDPPNRPISGKFGRLNGRDGVRWLEISHTIMVDNTFSMPGASGCGGPGEAPLVDSTIDRTLGLPSPDGHNTIVENNTLWEGEAEAVIASEG